MSLNVAHYEHNGDTGWGVIRNDMITPIPGTFASTAEFLANNSPADLANLQGDTLALSEVRLLSPVTRHQQFICQGANYRQHMIESGMDPDAKTFNMIFRKASSCMVGANSDLQRPPHVALLDYEIELGLVLKRDILSPMTITDSNLHEFVAGIVIVNDYSARDVQIPQMQFYKGKSYRTFGPVGPYLCLLEPADMHYLKKLDLRLTVNGETRQQDSTANLVFGPAETLTELAGVQDLCRGDLIATGTPSGCALRIPSPLMVRVAGLLPESAKWAMFLKGQAKRGEYLRNGDVVESRIRSADGVIDLGVQMNRVVEATR